MFKLNICNLNDGKYEQKNEEEGEKSPFFSVFLKFNLISKFQLKF